MFTYGKRAYVKVDPYRKNLKFSKSVLLSVQTGFKDAANLYWLHMIQNNLDESWNCVLREFVALKGPRTLIQLSQRIRSLGWSWNNPKSLTITKMKRHYSSKCVLGHTLLSIPGIKKDTLQVSIQDRRKKIKNRIIRN